MGDLSGDFIQAEKLLGHPYFIMGRVVYGRQLGRLLNAPTVNIRLQRYRAALNGVYSVTIDGLDRPYQGIANIGIRPTVDGKEPLLEVHLFDFDQDIYHCNLDVDFIVRLRDEVKFPDVASMREQIKVDADRARRLLAGDQQRQT